MTFDELLAFAQRHPLLGLALLGITVALAYTEVARLFRGYAGIRPAELVVLINRDNALVIDLSPSSDFEKGHIAGSKSVQPSQFDPESKQLAAAKALPVVVVCRTGMSAGSSAKRLKKAGFEKVYLLEGGIHAWSQAGLPLVKGRRG